jgi:hypothetical protein
VTEPRQLPTPEGLLALVRPQPKLCVHGNPAGYLDAKRLNKICGDCRREEAAVERTGSLRERTS